MKVNTEKEWCVTSGFKGFGRGEGEKDLKIALN